MSKTESKDIEGFLGKNSRRHQGIPHVALDFCHKLYAVHKQELKELFTEISLVTTVFALDLLYE